MMTSTQIQRSISVFLVLASTIFLSPKISAADQAAPAATPAPASSTATPAAAPATATSTAATPAGDVNISGNETQTIGQVIWIQGKVEAVQGANTRPLTRRAPLYLHDTIVTEKDGSGEVSFTDSSVVTLRSETQIKIDEYNHEKGGPPGNEKSVMSLIKGGFRTITGAIPKANPEGYQVNTPVATIGVRGTDYTAFYSAQHGLQMRIDTGRIIISNAEGTLELNKELGKIYADIPHNLPPKLLEKETAILVTQPAIRSAPAPTNNNSNGNHLPGGGVNIPGGPGNHPPGGGTGAHPGSGGKGGFCIGLMRDLYNKVVNFFG
jgi:hypothetical protein